MSLKHWKLFWLCILCCCWHVCPRPRLSVCIEKSCVSVCIRAAEVENSKQDGTYKMDRTSWDDPPLFWCNEVNLSKASVSEILLNNILIYNNFDLCPLFILEAMSWKRRAIKFQCCYSVEMAGFVVLDTFIEKCFPNYGMKTSSLFPLLPSLAGLHHILL